MKRLIAILLALAATTTFALTSCKKQDDDNKEDPNKDLVDTPQNNDDPSDSGDGKGEDQPSDSDPDPVTPVEFETVNDTIYVLFPANIRQEPSMSGKALGATEYTEELVRTGTNGVWNRIEYKGETAYILANLTTNDKDVITFNTLETPKTVYVNVLEQMNLRITPCYYEGFDSNIGVSGVKRGEELTLIAENTEGNWVKVEYTDKNGKTGKYYCRPGNISETKPSDDPNEDVNDETPITPAG